MRPLSPGDGLSPLGLLHRGPDYLRRQLEGSGRGQTPSAVERLEADKAKYVKSQQVINSRQEPVLLCHPIQSSPCCRRPLVFHLPHEFPQDLVVSQDGPGPKKLPLSPQSPAARRGSGRRMLRPDSLVIYRQKRVCSVGNKENTKAYDLVKWLFQGTLKEGHGSSPSSQGLLESRQLEVTQEETSMVWVPAEKEEMGAPSRVDLQARSEHCMHQEDGQSRKSEISSSASPGPAASKPKLELSYSLPFSEKERFFNYCGLDRNLVEVLGAEQFKPGSWEARSVCPLLGSVGSASSEHSTVSHNEPEPLAEEQSEKLPASISVIERNARVIKWLYSCQQAQIAAKESTV